MIWEPRNVGKGIRRLRRGLIQNGIKGGYPQARLHLPKLLTCARKSLEEYSVPRNQQTSLPEDTKNMLIWVMPDSLLQISRQFDW